MKAQLIRLRGMYHTVRTEGFKVAWRKHGWRLAAVVFTYYLVRDLFLYVFLPLLVARAVGAS